MKRIAGVAFATILMTSRGHAQDTARVWFADSVEYEPELRMVRIEAGIRIHRVSDGLCIRVFVQDEMGFVYEGYRFRDLESTPREFVVVGLPEVSRRIGSHLEVSPQVGVTFQTVDPDVFLIIERKESEGRMQTWKPP